MTNCRDTAGHGKSKKSGNLEEFNSMLTVDRKKTDEGNKLNKVQNKFLSEGKHKEKEDERRKL